MQELTIALTKGRLAGQTMSLFEKAGFRCEEMKEDSRKLIFRNEDQKLNFFLSKGPDVPTYVEYGAADIGVVGSDIIMEENRRAYEVLDRTAVSDVAAAASAHQEFCPERAAPLEHYPRPASGIEICREHKAGCSASYYGYVITCFFHAESIYQAGPVFIRKKSAPKARP